MLLSRVGLRAEPIASRICVGSQFELGGSQRLLGLLRNTRAEIDGEALGRHLDRGAGLRGVFLDLRGKFVQDGARLCAKVARGRVGCTLHLLRERGNRLGSHLRGLLARALQSMVSGLFNLVLRVFDVVATVVVQFASEEAGNVSSLFPQLVNALLHAFLERRVHVCLHFFLIPFGGLEERLERRVRCLGGLGFNLGQPLRSGVAASFLKVAFQSFRLLLQLHSGRFDDPV